MADYQVPCNSGVTRWQSDLTRTFNIVAPRDNWKNPIDVVLDVNRVKRDPATANDFAIVLISDAVIHFTGSVPTITKRRGDVYAIKAIGYYAAVGA